MPCNLNIVCKYTTHSADLTLGFVKILIIIEKNGLILVINSCNGKLNDYSKLKTALIFFFGKEKDKTL